MKSKKAILNISTEALSKLSLLLLGIFLPKLYIENYGSEINGLISSLTGIFVYLNLLEAGVGGASIQALYSPLSNKDTNKINGVLSATNIFYKKTGVYFLACVSFLAFIYPAVVNSELKFSLIVIIILITAIPPALRFFYQGKYIVLLNADNKMYILNLFSTIFNILSNGIKILLILSGENIIFVQSSFAVISILEVIVTHFYIKHKYPNFSFRSNPDHDSISKKGSVLIHQIASTIFNNIDVLLLTIACDLKVVSVYTVYNMIFMQTGFLVKTISNGLTASFGHLFFENKIKFKQIFNCFETYFQAIVFSVFVSAGILTLPFLNLYIDEEYKIEYIDNYLPILFMIVHILSNVRWPAVIAINVAGHFKETQWRAIIEMIINLTLSIVLVMRIGIYGVLIATIIALTYRSIDMIIYLYVNIIKENVIKQFMKIILYGFLAAILIYIYPQFNITINNFLMFFIVAIVVFTSITILFIVIALLIERNAARTSLELYRKLSKKKRLYE